jgi:hypothetical protein
VIDHPDAPEGKGRKYARPELERRFLLDRLPEGTPTRRVRIEDRYLVGTRLRLRRSTDLHTGAVDHKLGQKVPAPDGRPGLITNVYLSPAEYEALAVVPALELRKVRWSFPPFGVDEFEGELTGLILAEAEFESEEEQAAFEPPVAVIAEVTADVRFTGGRFVKTSASELRALLREFEIRPT